MATYNVHGDNVESYGKHCEIVGKKFEKQFGKTVRYIRISDVNYSVTFWVNGEYPYSLENGKIKSPKNY